MYMKVGACITRIRCWGIAYGRATKCIGDPSFTIDRGLPLFEQGFGIFVLDSYGSFQI